MSPRILIPIALAVLAFAGCGGDDDTPKKTALDGPYIGRYTANLTVKDAVDARMAGKQDLVLRPNGTYAMSNPFDGPSSGRYRAGAGNTLVFGTDEGCVQGGLDGTGVYRWRTLSGNRIRFALSKRETGGCTGRTDALVAPTWQRR